MSYLPWKMNENMFINNMSKGDISVLTVNEPSDQGNFPILESKVEAAIQALKMGKSAGIDNIPAELIKAGGHIVIQILLDICNKIWEMESGHQTGQNQ